MLPVCRSLREFHLDDAEWLVMSAIGDVDPEIHDLEHFSWLRFQANQNLLVDKVVFDHDNHSIVVFEHALFECFGCCVRHANPSIVFDVVVRSHLHRSRLLVSSENVWTKLIQNRSVDIADVLFAIVEQHVNVFAVALRPLDVPVIVQRFIDLDFGSLSRLDG